jgi:hypothetical protein
MTDEKETKSVADAYALLRKIKKRRIEIQKEIIELDSKLGLGPGSESAKKYKFFRYRPKH